MLSVTDLSTYEYCKRKLFLSKIIRLVQPPNAAMARGNVAHGAFEMVSLSEEKIVTNLTGSTYEEIFTEYKKEHSEILKKSVMKNRSKLAEFNLDMVKVFRELWPAILVETKERAKNVFDFMQKSGLKGQELWDNLSPKIQTEVRLSSKELGIRGIVDKLKVYKESVDVFELKTGRAPQDGVWPGHKLQLGAYIMLLKQNNYKVRNGFVSYLEYEDREVAFNPFLEQKIIDLKDEINSMLEKKELPDRINNENKCAACAFREKCYNDNFMEQQIQILKSS